MLTRSIAGSDQVLAVGEGVNHAVLTLVIVTILLFEVAPHALGDGQCIPLGDADRGAELGWRGLRPLHEEAFAMGSEE